MQGVLTTYPWYTGWRVRLGRISPGDHSRLFLLGLHRNADSWRSLGWALRGTNSFRRGNLVHVTFNIADTRGSQDQWYHAYYIQSTHGLRRGNCHCRKRLSELLIVSFFSSGRHFSSHACHAGRVGSSLGAKQNGHFRFYWYENGVSLVKKSNLWF